MFTYNDAKEYLIQKLSRDMEEHIAGHISKIGDGFDYFDKNLPRNEEPQFRKLHVALNFWDGWQDARNHNWKYYKGIRSEDWPSLAKIIVEDLKNERDISEERILHHFDPSGTRKSMTRKMIIKISRWFLFIGIIFLGLMYLNNAAACYWAAGGPPTEYPHALAQMGLINFGYGVSLFATGIIVFIILKDGSNWRKSKIIYIWIIVIILCLGYPKVKEWLMVDKCLDSGGSWDSKHFDCIK